MSSAAYGRNDQSDWVKVLDPKTTYRTIASRLILALALINATGPAAADNLPQGGSVAAGSAAISTPSSTHMTINQSSQNAVVNWQSFSIGQGSRVDIKQPSSSSALLNRVTGSTTSTIAGQLNANGQVYLVNPNGITITKSGSVKAGGGFVASSLDTSNDDFMAGKRTFQGQGGAVRNHGKISVGRGGYAALLGGEVENAGTITVPMGKVGLGSGQKATLDLSGDGFLQVAVPSTNGSVSNSGRIRANGGSVEMKAAAARDAARSVVNMSGVIEARSVGGRSGRVVLGGSGGGVRVTGKIDASARHDRASRSGKSVQVASRGKGGTIEVTGRNITLESANIDVSGPAGGGRINIGGGMKGEGPLQRAETVTVDRGSSLLASATEKGDGGSVVVWSDNLTTFGGHIAAKGGALGGNGGFAEVSGKALLDYQGVADLSAPQGDMGTLLLDPFDILISSAASSNISGATPFSPSANSSILNVNTLINALGSANVIVTTAGPGSQAGNITVAAPITWSSGTTLTLTANAAIAINADITATGANAGLALNHGTAGYTLGPGAAVTLSGTGSTFSVNNQDYTLIRDVNQLQLMQSNLRGRYALATDIDASSTAGWDAGQGFAPVGTGEFNAFEGAFHGLGHNITALTIERPTAQYAGLFGYGVGNFFGRAVIRDVGLVGGSIRGGENVGALVGLSAGASISSSYSTASVDGTGLFPANTTRVGGLVGNQQGGGSITTSYATGVVRGSASNTVYVGGLVGINSNSVASSSASGSVFATGTGASSTAYAGGLIGFNQSVLENNYAFGDVTATAPYVYAGGLLGLNLSAQTNGSYASGRVRGSASAEARVGGLIGYNRFSSIGRSYATGAVSADAVATYVGGLIGENDNFGRVLSEVYATGNVSGSAPTISLGGLVGFGNYTIEKSYWDISTTGAARAIGNVVNNPSGATSLTTAQARTQGSFTNFNFSTDWAMIGDARPFLRSEYSTTITNAHQLQLMQLNLGASYTLGRKIDASATAGTNASDMWSTAGFVPVGSSSGAFTGTLNGDGQTIAGLTINRGGDDQVGLFGLANAQLRNVALVGGSITGNAFVGSVAGRTIGGFYDAISSTASVSGRALVGGLIGLVSGTVQASFASGAIGGLNNVGGLVGYNSGGNIQTSFASGSVNGNGAGESVGGLVGYNDGTIKDTYATGTVVGGTFVGGLVGYNTGVVQSSYANGAVTGVSSIGGLVAVTILNGRARVVNSFWDVQSSGRQTSSGGTGLSSSQMKDPFTFINAGWDFVSVWGKPRPLGANPAIPNNGYMMLRPVSVGLYDDYVKVGNASRIYGNDNSTISGAALSGVGTANLLVSWGSEITAATNAGVYAYSTPNVISILEQTPSRTVYFDSTSGQITIQKAVLTVSGTKVYDQTTAFTTQQLSLSGGANGESIALTAGSGNVADRNVGTYAGAFSNLEFSVSGGNGLVSNYTLPSTGTLDITRALISSVSGITAESKVYDSTRDATLDTTAALFNGKFGGDVLTVATATGTFDTKNVGTSKTVSIAGITLGGIDAGNYTLVSSIATTTADITRALISSVSGITAESKVYDSTRDATLDTTAALFNGKFGGDVLTVATATGTFDTKNVGTSKTVSIAGITLGGIDAGNYTLVSTTATTTADITRALISSVSGITAESKVYDSTRDATLDTTAALFNGKFGGDVLTVATATGTFDTKNVGTSKTVSIAGITLGGIDAGNYTLVSSIATTTADITRALISSVSGITAESKVYDSTRDATLDTTAAIFNGQFGGDTLTVATATGTFDTKNVGTSKTVSIAGITLGGIDAGNYTLVSTAATTTADITRALISSVSGITAESKVYDSTRDATLDTTAALFNGKFGGDVLTVATATGTFDTKNVGTSKTVSIAGITLGGIDAGNYTLVSSIATTTADITRALISSVSGITAESKVYDSTRDATLDTTAAIFNGQFGGDTLTVATATGTFDTKNVGTSKTVSIAGITLGGIDAGNYTLVSTTATTTADITRALISSVSGITAESKVYDSTRDATLDTTAAIFNGKFGGDTLTVATATGTFDTKNVGTSKTVSIAGITLGGIDAGNYTLVSTTATTTADITRALISSVSGITAESKVYDSTRDATLDTTAAIFNGKFGGDTLTVATATGTFDTKNVGTSKTVSIAGITLGGVDAGNYTLDLNSAATADVLQRPITLMATAGQGKVYGAADAASFAYQIQSGSPLAGSDSFVGAIVRQSGENVGSYAFSIGTLNIDDGNNGANYQISFIGSSPFTGLINPFVITQRPITVTADGKTKVYGNTDPALTYEITNGSLAFSDAFTGGLTRVAGEDVGNYGILQGTLALSSNYNLSYAGANLAISQRPITVTVDNQSRRIGELNPLLTYRMTSGTLVNGDLLSGILITDATLSSPMGAYAINQGTLSATANYALTFVPGTLTVGPPLTVSSGSAASDVELPGSPWLALPLMPPLSGDALEKAISGNGPLLEVPSQGSCPAGTPSVNCSQTTSSLTTGNAIQ